MKALFVGLGGVGQRHLRNLLRLRPEAKVGAVRHSDRRFEIRNDLTADMSTDIVEKYGIRCFSDFAAAIAWRPDLAVVANPSALHASTAIALISAGIPVLLEKPVATNRADADALIAAARESKAPVVTGFVLEIHPASEAVLRWIVGGRIGRILSAQIACHNFLPHSHPYERWTDFYIGRKDLGGGVILSETHSIEFVHRLFGLPKRVLAVGGRLGRYESDVEDTVSVLLEYQRDGRPLPVQMHLSMVERPVERFLALNGEGGRIEWRPLEGYARVLDPEGAVVEVSPRFDGDYNDLFVEEMRRFLTELDTGEPGVCGLQATFGAQTLAFAIQESLATGQPATPTKERLVARS